MIFNKKNTVFYGRRKGRGLSNTLAEKAHARLQSLSVDRWAQAWPDQVWLEIGFGFGEHLVHWLAMHPTCAIVGAEVFENGIVSCVNQVPEQDAHRVAIFDQPATELCEKIPDQGLAGMIIRFPDPWPKRRHQGRRLIQDAFLQQWAPKVRMGGALHFASDHGPLVDFTYGVFQNHAQWHGVVRTTVRPQGWATSRYEDKALARGDVCHYAVWHRT